MTDYWDFYFTEINDTFASVCLSLGLRELLPVENYSILSIIDLHLNNPMKNGMPSDTEFQDLRKIEEILKKYICNENNGIFVARVTHNCKRKFVFYSTEYCTENIKNAFDEIDGYSYNLLEERDEQWKFYTENIYPNDEEYQCMVNKNLIEGLKKFGDQLTQKRDIHHRIYFKRNDDLVKFKEYITNERFDVIEDKPFKVLDSESQSTNIDMLSLHIVRDDMADLVSINSLTLQLISKAKLYSGEYDGWEARLIKEKWYKKILNKFSTRQN